MRILPDMKFNLIIFIVAILNFVLMFIFEVRARIYFCFIEKVMFDCYKEYIIENNWIGCKRHHSLSNTSTSKDSYSAVPHIKIENTLRLMSDWPPILAAGTTTINSQHTDTSLVDNT